ncbi:unnamed protein product [Ilex paraguariensis]|uniref:MATH domain-containing protein n=1 Tax=Ilex paraguariensis TaxID=185542 RepID=A0ABC8T0U9_9AQUA
MGSTCEILFAPLLSEPVMIQWEYTGEPARSGSEFRDARSPSFSKSSTSEYSPAKMLLNGVGWSIPQSQGNRVSGRPGNIKEELPWKIRSSIIHSVRAHHGALRSFAVCRDECTVFSAGVGPGFRGTVQKWELSRIDCLSGYYGHDEVVNEICVLPSSERVASCDGTVHVWNSQTGRLISVFTEFSANSAHLTSPLASAPKMNFDQAHILNFNPLSSGIMTTAFDGSLYTSMHCLESTDMLVVGTGNGSLRFIDFNKGQKLHLWRSESVESSFPSLISSICSSGFDKMQANGTAAFPSWIAAGLSSGNCRLLDMRSGNIIASWQAHDGYVTKLAAPEDHLLVSSSLDRTLRIWDLRRNWTSQPIVVRGHNDSVSSFSVWGQDLISISKNKIGLSSLSRSVDEDGKHCVTPQHLYMADHESRNLSVLSSITILPFSRLFLVGTEDGFLKICCGPHFPIPMAAISRDQDGGPHFPIPRATICRDQDGGPHFPIPRATICRDQDGGRYIPTYLSNPIPMAAISGDQDGVLKSVSDTPPTHFTLKIQLFSLLTKNNIERYTSGDFEAAGYKWKLVLYPNGNKNKNIKDHISFYLMISEVSSLHPGWEVHAAFRLFLLDQNKDNYLTLQDTRRKGRRFYGMKLEWGFDRFIPLTTFSNPDNGYLVNDTCVFGAEVFVCQEKKKAKEESLLMMKDAIKYKHTWKIEKFLKLDKGCEDSDTFNAGDQKWKIQLYPKGKSSGIGTHISLYLALADPTALPPGSKIFAEFILRILDQTHSNHDFGKATYWFSASNQQCGWPRFISLSYFNSSFNGFLVKDSSWVEAEVIVHGVANAQ